MIVARYNDNTSFRYLDDSWKLTGNKQLAAIFRTEKGARYAIKSACESQGYLHRDFDIVDAVAICAVSVPKAWGKGECS